MKTLLFAAAAAACLGAGTISADARAADRYVLDMRHSHVQFSVMRFGFNHIIGQFRGVEAVFNLDEENPENTTVSAVIEIASLESSDDERNEILMGEFWFNEAEYPTMEFHSTGVERTGEATAVLTGDLTLHGQTHPVSLDVVFHKLGTEPSTRGGAAGFTATGRLNRSQWGMTTAIPVVGDAVDIRIEALGLLQE
ncbi:MAG: YceI family protein [Parvularculaceae bacterium]